MKNLKKVIILLLTVLMLVTVSGCKTRTATKAVDKYLKEVQKSPFNITMWFTLDSELRPVVEDLIAGFEYKILGEEDYESDSKLTQKAVSVEITGYDIGGYYEKFFTTYVVECIQTLYKTYSVSELTQIMKDDPEKFKELYQNVVKDYFKQCMAECKEAGKTYTSKDGKIIAYYNTHEKEWMIASNEFMANNIDLITGNMVTIINKYSASTDN